MDMPVAGRLKKPESTRLPWVHEAIVCVRGVGKMHPGPAVTALDYAKGCGLPVVEGDSEDEDDEDDEHRPGKRWWP